VSADTPRSSFPADSAAMRRWHEEANPGHYRQLALYQQVLREVLPRCVDQAVFQLATQLHPGRYTALSPERRQLLHQRLAALVQRCSSLLTVEQLSSLAARLHRQRQNHRRSRQRQLLERLIGGADPSVLAELQAPPDADQRRAEPLPPGSVSLGLELPLHGDRIGWAAAGTEAFTMADALQAHLLSHERDDEADDDERDDDEGDEERDDDDGDGDPEESDQDPEADQAGFDTDLWPADSAETLLRLARGAENRDGLLEERFLQDSEAEPTDDASEPELWQEGGAASGLLPRDPLLLETWLRSYDLALSRRLRSLSHAINSELMRSDLLPFLLPASLLDAALQGRIETLGAAPNLLRLPLPLALPGQESPLQATVLLLRCADLELEEPRLRSLRRDLQRRRLEGRRMAQHHRRLQRRRQAREAEALWLEDIRTRSPEPPAQH